MYMYIWCMIINNNNNRSILLHSTRLLLMIRNHYSFNWIYIYPMSSVLWIRTIENVIKLCVNEITRCAIWLHRKCQNQDKKLITLNHWIKTKTQEWNAPKDINQSNMWSDVNRALRMADTLAGTRDYQSNDWLMIVLYSTGYMYKLNIFIFLCYTACKWVTMNIHLFIS